MLSRDASPAEIVTHAVFVRRLAFHLLRDDADADDATQETMLRAIARPPRTGGGVRAWLASVLRNVVRMRRRGDARRRTREGVASRPDRVPPAASDVARAEILRAVVAAVEALAPADRELVFLRHFEGLPPRAIALRIGAPVATVKSRLARTHERLRCSLADRRGGNVEGWRSALGAFVGFDVVHRGAHAAPGAIAVGTATKVAGGVMVLGCLAAGGWWVSTRDEPPAGADRTPAPETRSTAPTLAGRAPRAPAPAAAADVSTAAMAAGAGTASGLLDAPSAEFVRSLQTDVAQGRIEGVVLVGTGRATRGKVVLRHDAYGTVADVPFAPGDPVVSGTIGEDGTFTLGDDLQDSFTLEVAAEGCPPVFVSVTEPRQSGTKRLVIVLGDRVVRGRAFDRMGRPAVGVAVLVGGSPKHPSGGTAFMARTTSAADGSYEIRDLSTGPYIASAYLRPEPGTIDRRDVEADGNPSGTTVIDLGSETAEPLWSGAVRGADGRAVPGPSTMWLIPERASPYIGREVRFDAEGRFSSRLPAGTYAVYVNVLGRTLPRMLPTRTTLSIRDDLVQDVTVPGVRLRGSVRRADTRESFTPHFEKLHLQPKGGGRESWLGIALADDGRFATVGILPGTYEVLGWPSSLMDSSGRTITLEVREDSPDIELELYVAR